MNDIEELRTAIDGLYTAIENGKWCATSMTLPEDLSPESKIREIKHPDTVGLRAIVYVYDKPIRDAEIDRQAKERGHTFIHGWEPPANEIRLGGDVPSDTYVNVLITRAGEAK